MPVIKPMTELKLISNARLDNNYLNQMLFPTRNQQSYYFLSKVAYSFPAGYQYIRRDESIRVPVNYEKLYNCDYVMYKNSNFGDRWVYAFIIDKEYVNDGMTRLRIETDCFQTWMFDIQYFKSFIARSHQQEFDTRGIPLFDNLYPENLEFGRDYVVTHTERLEFDNYVAVICSSAALNRDFGTVDNPSLPAAVGGVIDKMPTALSYYVIDNLNGNTEHRTCTVTELFEYLSEYPWISQCIQSITIVPAEVVSEKYDLINVGNLQVGILNDGYTSDSYLHNIVNDIYAYFPEYKHQKMYSYPYSYIEMTAYDGTNFILKPEALNDESLSVWLLNYVGAQPRLAYYIDSYNDYGDNGYELPSGETTYGDFMNASLTQGNYPQLPVTVDNYLLYMANNANSFKLTNTIARYNQMEGIVGGAAQMLTGNIGGGISTMYSGIKNGEITMRQQAAKIQDAEMNPPSMAGQSGGDAFNISNGITGITFKWHTVRPQYADRLEAYFERYGYLQNKIDYPVIEGMSSFNYIQTTDIMLGGNIPDEDMNKICQMFNNGVTIWHNQDVGNYYDNYWM